MNERPESTPPKSDPCGCSRSPQPDQHPGEKLVLGTLRLAWRAFQVSTSTLFSWLMAKAAEAEALQRSPEVPARDEDRNIDSEHGVNVEQRAQWATALVTLLFAGALAAGIGFLFLYWTGGSNELLGGTLALFLAGCGATLVVWSHLLTIHKQAVEPREHLKPPAPQQVAAHEEFNRGYQDIQRRSLLKWMAAAGLGVMATMVVSVLRSFGSSPNDALYTTVWKRGQPLMTPEGKPVTTNALQPGDMMLVFPENAIGTEKAQTVLVRVHEDLLQLPAARSHWAPSGYLAFSRLCTHAGCPVGMYERTAHLLMCPCHQSTFDVLRGAQPTSGPAARPLPQLPLYADSTGVLRAADGFSEPPGPGFWGMP
jgi:quinol---cytochrome c reductase iron-sulfur subunit